MSQQPTTGRQSRRSACLVIGHDPPLQANAVAALEEAGVQVFDCGSSTTDALSLLNDWDFGAIVIAQGLGMRDVLQLLHLLKTQSCPIFVVGGNNKRRDFFNNHGAHGYFALPEEKDTFVQSLLVRLAPETETRTSQNEVDTFNMQKALQGLDMVAITELREAGTLENIVERFIGTMPEWISELEASIEEKNDFMVQSLSQHIVRAAGELGATTVAQCAHDLFHQSERGLDTSRELSALEDAFHVVFRSLLPLRHNL